MLTHFVIVLRHLRTPRERPLAFRPIACCHLRQSRLTAIATQFLPWRANFGLLSSAHAEKMQALFRLCLLSAPNGGSSAQRTCRRQEIHLFANKKSKHLLASFGGKRWIRTTEVGDNRFTVCSLWPLGNLPIFWSWWSESNQQPADYKSAALPIELHQRTPICSGASGRTWTTDTGIFSPLLLPTELPRQKNGDPEGARTLDL